MRNNNSEKLMFNLVGNTIAINRIYESCDCDIFSVFLSGFNNLIITQTLACFDHRMIQTIKPAILSIKI